MSAISEYEGSRILEFFKSSEENEKKLISIAKTITKNTLTHLSINDAYKIVLLHSDSVNSILNRKTVSKEMLYKYLTDKNIPITNNFTKTTLVEQILFYWKNTESQMQQYQDHQQQQSFSQQSQVSNEQHTRQTENFPINIMSRNFSSWFYKNYNDFTIQPNDFWSDCTCVVRIIDKNGDLKEDSTITSRLVLNLLYSIRGQFNFYFNPNLSHEGTRGKMDLHGFVLILCCGTLHSHESVSQGVFESAFSLCRDPFSDNNWKIKNIKLQLQSQTGINRIPELQSCSSLQQFLTLPESDEITL
ncbi:hypothetical protein PVAND_006702 [Polypedilum vanderplanki]|uniref:Uncharacterized protein n=1 Tax=Polypedilum vanderplanki TaxID=319348 RepID=A0A9J6C502_POLVA|nr:hypothetical protein PVAND_006702 [Polypedilum vanderplanki]